MVRRILIASSMVAMLSVVVLPGCKSNEAAKPAREEIPQIDPTTFVYNGQNYAVVHRPVAHNIFDVEVSGVAQAMTAAPTDGQIAMNAGAQFLAQNGLCSGTIVPALIPGSQRFDTTHQYWKQQFRCP